jgi:hypothetical protein
MDRHSFSGSLGASISLKSNKLGCNPPSARFLSPNSHIKHCMEDNTKSTQKRKSDLEEFIRKNPRTSTIEKEQLKEIEDEERKKDSGSGEVQY